MRGFECVLVASVDEGLEEAKIITNVTLIQRSSIMMPDSLFPAGKVVPKDELCGGKRMAADKHELKKRES